MGWFSGGPGLVIVDSDIWSHEGCEAEIRAAREEKHPFKVRTGSQSPPGVQVSTPEFLPRPLLRLHPGHHETSWFH